MAVVGAGPTGRAVAMGGGFGAVIGVTVYLDPGDRVLVHRRAPRGWPSSRPGSSGSSYAAGAGASLGRLRRSGSLRDRHDLPRRDGGVAILVTWGWWFGAGVEGGDLGLGGLPRPGLWHAAHRARVHARHARGLVVGEVSAADRSRGGPGPSPEVYPLAGRSRSDHAGHRPRSSTTGGAADGCTPAAAPSCGSSISPGRPGWRRPAMGGFRGLSRSGSSARTTRRPALRPHDRNEPEPALGWPRSEALRRGSPDDVGGPRASPSGDGGRLAGQSGLRSASTTAIGFRIDGRARYPQRLYGSPAYPDYDGDGADRVVFVREVAEAVAARGVSQGHRAPTTLLTLSLHLGPRDRGAPREREDHGGIELQTPSRPDGVPNADGARRSTGRTVGPQTDRPGCDVPGHSTSPCGLRGRASPPLRRGSAAGGGGPTCRRRPRDGPGRRYAVGDHRLPNCDATVAADRWTWHPPISGGLGFGGTAAAGEPGTAEPGWGWWVRLRQSPPRAAEPHFCQGKLRDPGRDPRGRRRRRGLPGTGAGVAAGAISWSATASMPRARPARRRPGRGRRRPAPPVLRGPRVRGLRRSSSTPGRKGPTVPGSTLFTFMPTRTACRRSRRTSGDRSSGRSPTLGAGSDRPAAERLGERRTDDHLLRRQPRQIAGDRVAQGRQALSLTQRRHSVRGGSTGRSRRWRSGLSGDLASGSPRA